MQPTRACTFLFYWEIWSFIFVPIILGADEVKSIRNGKLMQSRVLAEGGKPADQKYTVLRQPSAARSVTQPSAMSTAAVLKKSLVEPAELGLTLWTFRPSEPRDEVKPLVAISRPNGSIEQERWTPVRASTVAEISEGEIVRFTVEAPRKGFVYIIARDRGSAGYLGDPIVIFPRRATDDNATAPGKLVSAPVWGESRQVYYTFYKYDEQTHLDVVFLVTSTEFENEAEKALGAPILKRSVKLELPASELEHFRKLGVTPETEVTILDNAQVDHLIARWTTTRETLDRQDSLGSAVTIREVDASVGRAKLSQGDVGPQTVIRMDAKPGDAWMAVMSYRIVSKLNKAR